MPCGFCLFPFQLMLSDLAEADYDFQPSTAGFRMKYILLLICLPFTGCSTLLTMNSGVPYSGVQCNIKGLRKTFASSAPYYLMPNWGEGIFSTIDLPLSVVADTMILPYAFLNKDRPNGVETPQFRERREREFPETGENRF